MTPHKHYCTTINIKFKIRTGSRKYLILNLKYSFIQFCVSPGKKHTRKDSRASEGKTDDKESGEIKDGKEGGEKEPEEKEPEEPKPRALHRTYSLFVRNVAPVITKAEIMAVSIWLLQSGSGCFKHRFSSKLTIENVDSFQYLMYIRF